MIIEGHYAPNAFLADVAQYFKEDAPTYYTPPAIMAVTLDVRDTLANPKFESDANKQ